MSVLTSISDLRKAVRTFGQGDKLNIADTIQQGVGANFCSFLAYNSGTDSNVTGDATVATLDFDTEVFDIGANFATDTFTAPVTGKYLLTTNITSQGYVDAATRIIEINTSNRVYRHNTTFASIPHTRESITFSRVVDMDANDTAKITINVSGESGGDIIDISGEATIHQTSFSGTIV